jgi:hypothetical protein
MSFPVPKDVRGPRQFELVKGTDEMLRTSVLVADMTQPLVEGEFVKLDAQGRAAKLSAGDVLATPAMGACACWTLFSPGSSLLGQSDVLATRQAEVLSGPFQAKTQIYDPTANYLPGSLLVAVFDAANNRGMLAPIDPASATVRQLAAVVARTIQPPFGGQLWFESAV